MGFLTNKSKSMVQPIEKKALAWSLPWGGTYGQPYQSNWPVDRAIQIGMQQNIWVHRAVHSIAANAARIPFVVRDEHIHAGVEVEGNPLLTLLNEHPNKYESAYGFRYRLSSTILLSKMGAYIQILRSRRGEILELSLLNPAQIAPVPSEDNFIDHYVMNTNGKITKIPADQILWIKLPHPTDPWCGMTPLEAAGLAVETDILARQYNRNFLQNDGRPSGILAIKGGMEEQDAQTLRSRFLGPAVGGNGPGGAGRLTVIDMGETGLEYIDTSVKPRDAQYVQMMDQVKIAISIAFGVPESILGNASGRTYDNAAAEAQGFWRETMIPHPL